MLNYPVDIIDSTQGFTIQFVDVPEAITYGETLEEALENAVDCIDTAVEFYYEEKRAIPMPSSADGRYTVSPSPLVDLKIVLHNEMLAQKVSKAEMARRLKIAPPNFERVIDLRHKTKLETINSAFAALGKRLQINVVQADQACNPA